jgi:hypothetical protein
LCALADAFSNSFFKFLSCAEQFLLFKIQVGFSSPCYTAIDKFAEKREKFFNEKMHFDMHLLHHATWQYEFYK